VWRTCSIREFVIDGRSRLLERLEGQASPADLFATVPGIGEELAERIERDLHLDSLEELEAAAHDGRLDAVPGFGPRRVRNVQESLGHMLRFASSRRRYAHSRTHASRPKESQNPTVETLLEMDRRYGERSGLGQLKKIAPRRFNPEKQAWLPVLHEEIDGWTLTALFSNTARAHQLGRTGDWVVLYFEKDATESHRSSRAAGPAT
jgi:hypothetical protein